MFTKYVNKKVQETLNAKERVLARKKNISIPDNLSASSYKDISSIASRTPFFRMISNKKSDVRNVIISGGDRTQEGDPGNYQANMKHGFGDGEKGIYYQTKFGGKSKSGIRPIAGIKNVEVAYKGGFKALREATVNWTVGSLEELERLTPYFLTVGKTVMLDWGWVLPNEAGKYVSLQEQFGALFYNESTDTVSNTVFTDHQSKILDIGGNYGAMGGIIKNFEYQLREDGGFDCITKLISMGVNLFKKPVDKGVSDRSLIGKKDESGKVKSGFSPVDSLIVTILNLREMIIDKHFAKINTMDSELEYDWFSQHKNLNSLENVEALTKVAIDNDKVTNLVTIDAKGKRGRVGGVFTDPTQNIIWFVPNTDQCKNAIFVSWGWFEDQILNRYVSYVSKDEIKMTVRSLDTVLDVHGASMTVDSYKALSQNKNKSAVDLFGVPEIYMGESIKTPTQISNHPHLQAIDPLKFLLPGQNKGKDRYSIDVGEINKVISEAAQEAELTEIRPLIEALTQFVPDAVGEIGVTEVAEGQFKRTFKTGEDRNKGYLRNVFINITEIQKAFGFDAEKEISISKKNVASGLKGFFVRKYVYSISANDINPPSTVEVGIKNLLSQLNNNFFGIWDFELTSDPYDSTNIKIIDKKLTTLEPGGESIPYTKYGVGGRVDRRGIYKFPSYKIGSTVKNQNLAFKIPNAQALTAMYGSNKDLKATSNDNQHDNSDINNIFAKDTSKEYQDNYLEGMESTPRAVGWGVNSNFTPRNTQIGSINTLPNSKIMKHALGGFSVDLNPSGFIMVKVDKTAPEDIVKTATTMAKDDKKRIDFAWYKDDIVNAQMYKNDITDSDGEWELKENVTEGIDSTGIIGSKFTHPPYYFRDASGKQNTFVMTPEVVSIFRSVINGTVENTLNRESYYKSDYIIPAELTLEVDGIDGIIPGDIIQTDYIPAKYNKSVVIGSSDLGPFTYFQVFGVNQKIDSSGWTTEIETKMRTNKYVLMEDAAKVVNALDSEGTMVKTIDQYVGSNSTTVLQTATDTEIEETVADEENIEVDNVDTGPPSTGNLNSDDVTDGEYKELMDWKTIKKKSEEISNPDILFLTGLTFASWESDNTNVSLQSAGWVAQPTPLTGTNDSGNKVIFTIEDWEGPNGESLEQNTAGKYYYVEAGTGNAVVVTNEQLNKDGTVVATDRSPDSSKEAVLVSDLFGVMDSETADAAFIGPPPPVENDEALDNVSIWEMYNNPQ